MFKKILILLALILAVLVGVILMQPDDFKVSRSATINATPQAIFEQVNDFHKWEAWSPWAKLDPKAKTTYEGPESGVGASFAWSGDHNVGEGKQTIVESRPGELVKIRLDFVKPFAGTNDASFTFKPEGSGTLVTWTMSGKNDFVGKAVSLAIDCDTMVGGFFEEGLASIKTIVEAPAKP